MQSLCRMFDDRDRWKKYENKNLLGQRRKVVQKRGLVTTWRSTHPTKWHQHSKYQSMQLQLRFTSQVWEYPVSSACKSYLIKENGRIMISFGPVFFLSSRHKWSITSHFNYNKTMIISIQYDKFESSLFVLVNYYAL